MRPSRCQYYLSGEGNRADLRVYAAGAKLLYNCAPMGVMRTRQRENRLGAVASAMVALAAILAACSRDLSVNNLTLTPKPNGLPKNSDWSQAWGRSSSGTVTTADLVSSQGQCPLPPLAPTQSAMAGQAQAEPGGIALEMSECEVVHRTGPVEKVELGTTGRGERSLVLTYLKGPWPGVYRFTAGRLISIERAPAAPEPSAKAATRSKKPAGT
jgi:hypothetical protein